MTTKTSVPVVSKSYLRKGQSSLYELIVQKLDTEEKITLVEAKNIWLKDVHTKQYNGVPYRTDHYAERVYDEKGEFRGYTCKDVPMTEEEIDFSVMNWLCKNLGVLVIRGYLEVIPMIELK